MGIMGIMQKSIFQFTFQNLQNQYELILNEGYEVIDCKEYCEYKKKGLQNKVLVNRVDIDECPKRAERLALVFRKLNIKATFFIRLHAKEYNPFSFENYRILKFIQKAGFEIGYHSEIVDEAAIWQEDEAVCLKRDIQLLETGLGAKIYGIASHGGMTGLNNLDFWKTRSPQQFGLMYEAYDQEKTFNLFQESLYVSDSCWTYWKAYLNGVQIPNDHRPPASHAKEGHRILAMLIHPETYFDKHFYE